MRPLLLLALLAVSIYAKGENVVIPLWPNGVPNAATGLGTETQTTADRITTVTNISSPTLTLFRPSHEKDTGAAVVVFPGGGYHFLAIDLEGTEVCDWLNSLGVTGVLVKYRVPESANVARYEAPLQDAQRAVGIVRNHASEWNIDPHRIGVLGFSAGGHLAAVLLQHFAVRTYPRVDAADDANCRPDFAVLIYPAYLSVEDKGIEIAPEVQPNPGTPPLFVIQTEDDRQFIQGTLLYYRALVTENISAELHIYETGGHGYGLRPTSAAVTYWPVLAEHWLHRHHIIQ